jgi:hypothetical protein
MKQLRKIIGYIVFALQILLVFLLVFESNVQVPAWLQAFGRMHPLLLHLPIGLVLVTTLLIFIRRFFESPSFSDLITFLLYLTSFTASFSALMGILLSLEGGYNDSDLGLHKWLGVSLSFLCWILLNLKDQKILRPALAAGVVLLIFTGHFGANLTHGEDFVLGPLQTPELQTRMITDSSTLFSAAIEPIFESKCFSCHNEQKAKGRLILTTMESIVKGGKNGSLWKPGDPDHSLIMERLTLPPESKEHMPPKDKAQLSSDEIDFISRWIASGASLEQKLKELSETDTLMRLSASIILRYHQPTEASLYQFQFVSQKKISALSTPYRSVFQIAHNEPALQAEFYLAGLFDQKYLEELKAVKDQLILLNLSKMPVEDADLNVIQQFENLEKLILNNTNVQGEGLKHLVNLEHLRSVSLSGSPIKPEALNILAESKSLKEVFLWNTAVTSAEIQLLEEKFSHIHWDAGYQPDKNEMLRLSAPILRNDGQVLKTDENIMLKHNFPGAVIRYTLDGAKPDSINSPVYQTPLGISKYTVLKTKAYKDGWLSSDPVEYVFFKKGEKPSKAELITKPDAKYPGEGAVTLIDERKGMPDFYRDPPWMGFRNEPMEAYFFFEDNPPSVSNVTLSYARNIYALCMPPAEFEVWGGSDPDHLKLLNKIKPEQPTAWVSTRIEGAAITIPESSFACYKVIARPLSKLPEFRNEKKQKGWLMVDEIFFN